MWNFSCQIGVSGHHGHTIGPLRLQGHAFPDRRADQAKGGEVEERRLGSKRESSNDPVRMCAPVPSIALR